MKTFGVENGEAVATLTIAIVPESVVALVVVALARISYYYATNIAPRACAAGGSSRRITTTGAG